MMGYGLQKPFIGYGEQETIVTKTSSLLTFVTVDGLDPIKGARRMVEWLQSPLEAHPPAFAAMT